MHQASTSVAVDYSEGKLLMQSTIRTTPEAVRDFIRGLSGTVHVTFEEGTQSAWLYDLIKPLVAEVIVCDPRQNPSLSIMLRPGPPPPTPANGGAFVSVEASRRTKPNPRAQAVGVETVLTALTALP